MSDRPGHDRGRDARGRQRPRARLEDQGHRSGARPSQRRRTADTARLAAWQACRHVDEGAYANLDLPKTLRAHHLGARDAAFATELTYGTIRMRGLYDPIIARAAGRPTSQLDAPVLDTLRLGAHQLLSMRVPAHAAASETVALARQVNGAGAAGLVNAVLRRISERSRDEWVQEVTAGLSPVDRLHVEHSHPAWIVRAFRAALLESGTGADAVDEELARLLEADNASALVPLVARPGLATVQELVAAGAQASATSPIGALLHSGDPARIDAVRQTRAAVQDEGSQLLALALAAAPVARQGPQRWLDLCAGPGGKTALLAALSPAHGATVFANEISRHRTELVRRTLTAVLDSGIEVMVGTGDGRELGTQEPDTYDKVLVDAPCTGLGALRRRPEARWRKKPADVPGLTALQAQLLSSALAAVRPGGVVAYSTCSPHLAETAQVVQQVLARTPAARVEDARGLFVRPDGRALTEVGPGPFVQLWPHRHGTDAMFFALLRRTDES